MTQDICGKSTLNFGRELVMNPPADWEVENGEGGVPIAMKHKPCGRRWVLDPAIDEVTGCYRGRMA